MKGLLRVFSAPVKTWWQVQHNAIQGSMHNMLSHFFPQQPQLAGFDMSFMPPAAMDNEVSESKDSVFDWVILMAAPKSKISPSRKRQKHMRFFPDPVNWEKCEKCGEAKRPHRICTDHVEVCAMRPEEYEQHKARNGGVTEESK